MVVSSATKKTALEAIQNDGHGEDAPIDPLEVDAVINVN
jgi:hypothetical protein